MPSVFSKIILGELPAYKIFEDELTIAVLAMHQCQPGHTLVIPKLEVDHFMDVPEPHYLAVFRNAQKISRAIKKATGCERVGTTILGWEVPHFHYHLVPMFSQGDLDPKKAKVLPANEMESLQKRIIAALS